MKKSKTIVFEKRRDGQRNCVCEGKEKSQKLQRLTENKFKKSHYSYRVKCSALPIDTTKDLSHYRFQIKP